MTPDYRGKSIQLLSDPQLRIIDQGSTIIFERPGRYDRLVFHMNDNLCDYFIEGVQVARYFVHRYMLLVAMKRAIEDSI